MTEQLRFDGKVVVVTGAGNGLGRTYAMRFAARGAKVVVNDLGGTTDGKGSDNAAAQTVVNEIKAAGGEAVPSFDSVATPEGGAAIIKTAIDAYGRVDSVIANAGILRDKSFAKMTPDDIERVLDVHLRGTFYVVHPAYAWMRENGGGTIVTTTSPSGLFGSFGQANYCAAKMGIVGLTRVLAIEGAKAGIKANCIAPTAATRLTATVGMEGADDVSNPMSTERVAPVALALAHSSCPANGEVFSVAAGWVGRTVVAIGPGYAMKDFTPEDIAAHWDQVRDGGSLQIPRDGMDYWNLVQAALGVKAQ